MTDIYQDYMGTVNGFMTLGAVSHESHA